MPRTRHPAPTAMKLYSALTEAASAEHAAQYWRNRGFRVQTTRRKVKAFNAAYEVIVVARWAKES